MFLDAAALRNLIGVCLLKDSIPKHDSTHDKGDITIPLAAVGYRRYAIHPSTASLDADVKLTPVVLIVSMKT